jgi:peptide/nickel transport system substrate-binding protein
MNQKVLRVFWFLLSFLLLTGCSQEEFQEDESVLPPDSIVQEIPDRTILPDLFSLPYAPELTLDPVTCADGMQQVVSSLICEGLFRLGPDFEPTPWLCKSYTYDADTLTYTFTLREGVKFSDGTPLTGNDVKTTLLRAKNSERYGSRLAQMASVSADGQTVTVSLHSANTSFPSLLDIPILKAGTEDSPIGTGPYLFAVETSSAWLISNQSWWQGTAQPVDRIALIEASDQDTMLYRFTSHDVQLITADLTGTAPISATGSISYQDANTTILQYLGLNTNREPLNDAGFRRLLSQGIDRSHLVSAFLSGHGTPTQFPVSPVSPLYPAELERPYSLSDFSALLAESGYSADRPLSLLVNAENTFKVSVAQQIASAFSAAGISMTVNILPWEEYTAALLAGDFDLYYGEIKLSADWNLSPLLGSIGMLNYGGWLDPQFDQYLANYLASSDPAASMEKLCAYLQKQAPILPLCFKSTSVLLQTDVLSGLVPTMNNPFYNLTDCTIRLAGT